jgi:hypothetical protein
MAHLNPLKNMHVNETAAFKQRLAIIKAETCHNPQLSFRSVQTSPDKTGSPPLHSADIDTMANTKGDTQGQLHHAARQAPFAAIRLVLKMGWLFR